MTSLGALSVVIPVLDREVALAATLDALPPVGELIVADGGSSDRSVAIAQDHGASVVQTPPGRGRQLSAGAREAAKPWLLFLHADTRLDEAAWSAIEQFTGDPSSAGRAATFRLALDDAAWPARFIEAGVRARVAVLALPYGDQGLLIHQSLYQRLGGFSDLPLMEDVDLVRRIGRSRMIRLPGTATTSADRWRSRGWARQSATNLLGLSLYLCGVSPQRLARLYGRSAS